MTIFAPPRARRAQRLAARDQHDIALEGVDGQPGDTVSADSRPAGGPYRRRRDQRRIARYSSEEVAVYECVDRRRLQ